MVEMNPGELLKKVEINPSKEHRKKSISIESVMKHTLLFHFFLVIEFFGDD